MTNILKEVKSYLFSSHTHCRVLPRTPPTPTGRRSPPSPPRVKAAAPKTAHGMSGPLRANHAVLGGTPINPNYGDSISNRSLPADISPLTLHSSPSLEEEELFGLTTSSSSICSRLELEQTSDDKTTSDNNDMTEQQRLQRDSNSDKILHGMSKSGSCLEDDKTIPRSVLPTPPSFPLPCHSSKPSVISSGPVPSHSDSDLIHQPAPPSLRPGTVVGGSGHVRRRTVSPRPRLRVVDVTNLVGAHTGKGDSDIPCHAAERMINLSSSSASTSPYTSPTSTDQTSSPPSPEREHRIRPGSANRFREMVLGCRDAQ